MLDYVSMSVQYQRIFPSYTLLYNHDNNGIRAKTRKMRFISTLLE